MDRMWIGDLAKDWHPKEALYDLITLCSSLGVRYDYDAFIVFDNWRLIMNYSASAFVRAFGGPTSPAPCGQVQTFASEGLVLQSALYGWYAQTTLWPLSPLSPSQISPKEPDSQLTIALIYYHAIIVYLSGIYDYYRYWDHVVTATLTASDVTFYVNSILEMTEIALRDSNLAGILFFLPLRTAGAMAKNRSQRQEILHMLNSIVHEGLWLRMLSLRVYKLFGRRCRNILKPALYRRN